MKKNAVRFLYILILLILINGCSNGLIDISQTPGTFEKNTIPIRTVTSVPVGSYDFNGSMSREIMDSYLNRSITVSTEHINNTQRDELVRFVTNVGAKFWGRSSWIWADYNNLNVESEMAKAQSLSTAAHTIDSDIIMQAAIFETTSLSVNSVPIPSWVFNAFGIAVENRTFNYYAMLFGDGLYVDHWGNGRSVPDITKVETQMLIYFLAKRYIDAGIEAIHLGQVGLMGSYDNQWTSWTSVIGKIRSYASSNGRRGNILLDAHISDMRNSNNQSEMLLDFLSAPSRLQEVVGNPQDAVLEILPNEIIGNSPSADNPQGFYCAQYPYIIELDNYGGLVGTPGVASTGIDVWGYDEIAWFAYQNSSFRQSWLSYAYNWLAINDPVGHLQMPGVRTLGAAFFEPPLFLTGLESGDPGLTWSDTIIYSSNVSGFYAGISPECSVRSEKGFDGSNNSILFSGTADGGSSTNAYFKVYDVNIPINKRTALEYYIFPQDENARHVAVDLICTDGTSLRDSGAVDELGTLMHPGHARGTVNSWNRINGNIGEWLEGKTIDMIVIGYDYVGSTGTFRGYIDDIVISNGDDYEAMNPSGAFPLASGDEGTIKEIWSNQVTTVADPLNDFSKIYSHSQNLSFDSNNSANFEGDNSRLSRTTSTKETFTYKSSTFGDAASFEMIGWFWDSVNIVDFKFYLSGDNISYTEYVPDRLFEDLPVPMWHKVTYTGSSLPAGTKYIKVEFNNISDYNWVSQVGDMQILYQ